MYDELKRPGFFATLTCEVGIAAIEGDAQCNGAEGCEQQHCLERSRGRMHDSKPALRPLSRHGGVLVH